MGFSGVGDYSMLVEDTAFSSALWTQQYTVRVDAKFQSLLLGAPRMRLIKQWATGIVNGLQNDFDEQIIWRKAVESYSLRQHLPTGLKSLPLPFGPVTAQSRIVK